MKRLKAYLLMSLPYLIGCVGGWFIFLYIAPQADGIYKILFGLLLADVFATVIVWIFGVIFKNSSFYDAYWSLIPWLIIVGLMFRFNLWSPATILFIAPFGIWSWRLTINWAYTCKDLKTEDWRYTKYRADNKVFMWHIVNFFGINLMPTLIVFAALIPAVFLVLAKQDIGVFGVLGALIILTGTVLETVADISMHKFLKKSVGLNGLNNLDGSNFTKLNNSNANNCAKSNNSNGNNSVQNGLGGNDFDKSGSHKTSHSLPVHNGGLRKYSRHPNYLGEIMIWVGVYVSALSVPDARWWFAGMLAVILLFNLVSIPLAEKRHLARRPAYAEYKAHTRRLFPIPRFK